MEPGYSVVVAGEMAYYEQTAECICSVIGGDGVFCGYVKSAAELGDEYVIAAHKSA